MRRIFYLTASLLLLGGATFGQNGGASQKKPLDVQKVRTQGAPSATRSQGQAMSTGSRAACDGDTILYEDFRNGFAGNNSQGVSWDTTGNYQAWRACSSPCETNFSGNIADPGPLQSTTASNGYINLDVSDATNASIYSSNADAPNMKMTMGDSVDVSGFNVPVLNFETVFAHCCNADHTIEVIVSADAGTTWPDTFNIASQYGNNAFEIPNPEEFTIPLQPTINSTGSSEIKVQFYWPEGVDGAGQIAGVYNWYIDDVMIKEPNRNDVALAAQTAYTPDTAQYFQDPGVPSNIGFFPPNLAVEYTQIPECNAEGMIFGGSLCNVGATSLNDVQVQATVFDSGTSNQIWQGTSSSYALDSLTCQGSGLNGSPDTLWTTTAFEPPDTGGYDVQYQAVLNDTADCRTTNNSGNSERFSVTPNTYAIDAFDQIGRTSQVVSPVVGGSRDPFGVYNTFEFSWFDRSVDTVKQVCFYLDPDSTDAGAGPIVAGLSSVAGPNVGFQSPVFGQSQPYYVDQSDIGGWVCLDITRDTNGNPIDGVPVPVTDGSGNELDVLTTAFVEAATTGSNRVAISTSGIRQDGHALQYGDFFGDGQNLYTPNNVPMVRVKMNNRNHFEETVCDSFTVPSGDETYYSSGVYEDTLAGYKETCDSVFAIDLTVNNSTSASIQTGACSQYTVPSGDETYSTSGVYEDTIPNDAGCDSLLTIDLTIGQLDTVVNLDTTSNWDLELSSRLNGATYQWIDCDNGDQAISGETSQTFQPSSDGNYAVVVEKNGCTDTSNCHQVVGVGIEERSGAVAEELYPNPTTGKFTLDLGKTGRDVRMEITDLQGRVLKTEDNIDSRTVRFELDQPEGIYLVHLETDEASEVIKLVKE